MFSSFFKTIILASITLIAILYLSRISESQYINQPLVWTTSAMEAIERSQSAPAAILKGEPPSQMNTIQLMAARGEYEAFQIVIQAPKGNLNNVNVVVSDLKNKNGGIIDHKNITLYREHYMYVERPSPQGWQANPTLGVGWYADALIPFLDPDTGEDIQGAELDAVPFDLEAGNNQPIWVDVFVPRSAAPGEYQGTFTVESDRGKSEGQINLTVWDFDLPVKPSIDSFFAIGKDRGIEAQKLLLQHKLMPNQRVKFENQKEVIERWGLKSVRLPFWSGANSRTCEMKPAPSVQNLEDAASHYQSDLLIYVYSADEIDKCHDLEQTIKQWAKNIHEAGIKHLVVMKPKPELYDAIDIWVVQPRMYQEATSEIAEVMQQGDTVWFYTGHKDKYSPQWQIDSAPINFRIPQGWIAQSLGLTGVLYWRVDDWTDNPWQEVPVYSQGKNTDWARDFPGEGMLIYPGEKVGIAGVVPSMRLKWIREGVEDYEYIEILKQFGLEDWALKVSRTVGADWKNWTKNPQQLEAARVKLGNKIEQITR